MAKKETAAKGGATSSPPFKVLRRVASRNEETGSFVVKLIGTCSDPKAWGEFCKTLPAAELAEPEPTDEGGDDE